MQSNLLKRWIYFSETLHALETIELEDAFKVMSLPLMVITVEAGKAMTQRGDWIWCQGHLEHHFIKDVMLAVAEPSHLVNSIHELRHALQQGIVQLREKQVKAWVNGNSEVPSKELEAEALSLCRRLFWQPKPDTFERQIQVFCQMLMLRYRRHLNSYRVHLNWALVELWQQGKCKERNDLNSICIQQMGEISIGTDFLILAERFKSTMIRYREQCHESVHWQQKMKDWMPVVQEAYHWVLEHFREPISLRDVAEAVYVSSPYLAKVYKKDTGKTIVEEINGLRLTWARGELKNNPSSVTRMALEAGFNSPEHFQRLYKKKFGVTPGRDRG